MASTQTPKPDPLEGLTKLHDKVHLYTPPTPPPASSTDPDFLLMCSWAFAQPRHISKYIKSYQSLYPHTQILLVQIAINNMLFASDASQFAAYFNLAAQTIHSYVSSCSTNSPSHPPRILLQTYSNGGSHSAVQTAEAYKRQYGSNLPLSAIIFDSTPGQPHWLETAYALVNPLPKDPITQVLGTIAAHSMIAITGLMDATGLSELATKKLYRTLNAEGEAF